MSFIRIRYSTSLPPTVLIFPLPRFAIRTPPPPPSFQRRHYQLNYHRASACQDLAVDLGRFSRRQSRVVGEGGGEALTHKLTFLASKIKGTKNGKGLDSVLSGAKEKCRLRKWAKNSTVLFTLGPRKQNSSQTVAKSQRRG